MASLEMRAWRGIRTNDPAVEPSHWKFMVRLNNTKSPDQSASGMRGTHEETWAPRSCGMEIDSLDGTITLVRGPQAVP